MIAIKNILVATDFGACSAHALDYGRSLARTFGATLHVVHVVDDVFGRHLGMTGSVADPSRLQRDLEEGARRQLVELLARGGHDETPVAVMRTSSTPAAEIVAYAKDASVDLVIVGTHGRGGFPHLLLGSVAERVARTAPCPVLTVSAPEEERDEADPILVRANA
jgi:nucleotide-binding universal stress UspA family protein